MNISKNDVTNNLIPTEFYLSQNYPNPFKEKTTIKYCVPYKTRVVITIFNTYGKMLEKLVDEEKSAGTYEIDFETSPDLLTGTYAYMLEAGSNSILKKMIYKK